MTSPDEISLIRDWCRDHGINIRPEQITRFTQYLEMIRRGAMKMNLVSKNDLDQLAKRHLLDSLNALVAYEIPTNARTADLGSGSGFPGIPIAIARPDIKVDLIESRRLKSLFLSKAIEGLNITNARVIHSRWEDFDGTYDIIFARAVYNEANLREMAIPRLIPGGVLVYFDKIMSVKIINAIAEA